MENAIINILINKGIDLIEPALYDSWVRYVEDTVSKGNGIKEVEGVIDLLQLHAAGITIEELRAYSKYFSKVEIMVSLFFSPRLREFGINERSNGNK